MTTHTSEKGLETLIMRHMTGTDGLAPSAEGAAWGDARCLSAAKAAGSGWLAGNPKGYAPTRSIGAPPPQSKAVN